MMPHTAPRSRRPAGETRALMLKAAVERVETQGLQLDYANIELEDLIRAAGVPRSTVFRIWPDRMAFVADLVRALFEADAGFESGFDPETRALLQDAMTGEAPTLTTPEAREAGLRETIRVAIAHNLRAAEEATAWRTYRSVAAALASGDAVPGGDEIRSLLAELEARYLDRMAEAFRLLNDAFRVRMRAGLTERDLALAIMAVFEGMSDHARINPSLASTPRTLSWGNEPAREWRLAAVAVYGMYTAFTEPNAD